MPLRIIISLLSTVILIISCEQKNKIHPDSLKFSQLSNRLIEDKKFIEAQKAIDQSLEIDPDNYIALNNRSFIEHNEQHNAVLAQQTLEKVLSINPNYRIGLFNLANIYFDQKKYEDAIEASKTFKKKHGNNPEIDFIIGESYNYLEDYNSAIVALNKAEESLPNRAGIFKERSRAYRNLGNYDKAILDGIKAIRLDSCYHQAYNTLALAYDDDNNYKKALEMYDLAIKYDSTAYTYYCNRGLFKIEQLNQIDAGCLDLRNSLNLGSNLAEKHIIRYCNKSLKNVEINL